MDIIASLRLAVNSLFLHYTFFSGELQALNGEDGGQAGESSFSPSRTS
ncbi:hypothetical protein ACFO1S_07415 [Cohnella boryungensis]|uniref:Uncharacterized protein n=1 Tax=Cohnella boryungensis TaxID=768479 RepID=A0ABV8S9V5_9BACL